MISLNKKKPRAAPRKALEGIRSIGCWYTHYRDIPRFLTCLQLEKEGWVCLKHSVRFGTCLVYGKGSQRRYIFPELPERILTQNQLREILKERWQPSNPADQEFFDQFVLGKEK